MEGPIEPLDIEELWSQLLSRDPHMIRFAFSTLKENERPAVIAHLRRMVDEEGWHYEQKISAQAALDVIWYDNDKIKPDAGSASR